MPDPAEGDPDRTRFLADAFTQTVREISVQVCGASFST